MTAMRTRGSRNGPASTDISCDWRYANGDPCGAGLRGESAVAVRRALREMGWGRRGGKDYCPPHVTEWARQLWPSA